MGEGANLSGGTLKNRTAGTHHPQLALTLPSPYTEAPRPPTLPPGASIACTFRDPTRPHLPSALPARFPAQPGVRARIPPPCPATGPRGRRPRPLAGGIVSHPQQKRPKRSGVGGRGGERAHPCGPRGPADAEPRPTSSRSRARSLAPLFGLQVRVPASLPSPSAPTYHWPAQAQRAARVPPVPRLHQPSGKLSN